LTGLHHAQTTLETLVFPFLLEPAFKDPETPSNDAQAKGPNDIDDQESGLPVAHFPAAFRSSVFMIASKNG
jgi:hypothetical protein